MPYPAVQHYRKRVYGNAISWYFGLPPLSYINKFRISAAEEMLKNTNHTIKEIAASVGIDDPVYLNKTGFIVRFPAFVKISMTV